MSLKLKVLGLGLLAVMATSAFAAVNASAVLPKDSHFTAEPTEHHLILKGTDGRDTGHALVFNRGEEEGITCTHSKYHGTVSGLASTTTQQVTLRPEYLKCATQNSAEWGSVTVHVPSNCGTEVFKFTSAGPPNHGTVHVNCTITITHPNCTQTVAPQTPTGGIVYKTDTRNGKHSITADVTVTGITSQYHGGICIFLGTTQANYKMTGSATFWGEDTLENPVGITAT